ncbi:MAG: hypothetical protein ABI857_07665 [Acidobacteriota bacterium]
MTGIAELIASGGLIPEKRSGIAGDSGSLRRRGIMQGFFIFLLSFLIVPIMVIISIALDIEPFAVVISALLFCVGGLLRIAYAIMFQSGTPKSSSKDNLFAEIRNPAALPPSQSTPVSAYTSPAGQWRDTNDLQRQPASVTDSTTKLLQKNDPQ